MLTCREVCEKEQEYSDNRVSKLTRARMKLHILMCNNCNNFVKQTRQANLLVRQSFASPSDQTVSPKMMAAFRKKDT